jgi:hypothetical protein
MKTREKSLHIDCQEQCKEETAEQVPNIKGLLLNGPRFGDFRAYARSGIAAGR